MVGVFTGVINEETFSSDKLCVVNRSSGFVCWSWMLIQQWSWTLRSLTFFSYTTTQLRRRRRWLYSLTRIVSNHSPISMGSVIFARRAKGKTTMEKGISTVKGFSSFSSLLLLFCSVSCFSLVIDERQQQQPNEPHKAQSESSMGGGGGVI